MDYTEAAKIQLHKAIELFFAREFICSITLAGAADGILGEMIQHAPFRKSNSLDELIEDIHLKNPNKDKKWIRDQLNNSKNILKHYRTSGNLELKPYTDSILIIMRAIQNYEIITNKATLQMISFRQSDEIQTLLFSE